MRAWFSHQLTTDCCLRSWHFHSAFSYVIIRWWLEMGHVWPELVCSFRTLCKIVELKIGGKTQFENLLKQLFHSPLLDMKWLQPTHATRSLVTFLFITSYPTWAHGIIIIVIYSALNRWKSNTSACNAVSYISIV